MTPSCNSTMRAAMVRPRPVPSSLVVKNGSNRPLDPFRGHAFPGVRDFKNRHVHRTAEERLPGGDDSKGEGACAFDALAGVLDEVDEHLLHFPEVGQHGNFRGGFLDQARSPPPEARVTPVSRGAPGPSGSRSIGPAAARSVAGRRLPPPRQSRTQRPWIWPLFSSRWHAADR